MRYLINFSYDGTYYSGFQKQKGLNTIQGKMEEALTKINNGNYTTITATGRTDKGVHAICQYGHADIDVEINEKKLKRALNSNLPADIHVIETKEVPQNFHARYFVKSKTYKYIINTGEYNPLERNYVFQYNHQLNTDNMKQGLEYFKGTHDFRAFVTDNKNKDNCVRTIESATLQEDGKKIIITFTGNGFLRYQVRNMIGILIKIGENKLNPQELSNIIASADRTKAGKTAPSEGLYLLDIKY